LIKKGIEHWLFPKEEVKLYLLIPGSPPFTNGERKNLHTAKVFKRLLDYLNLSFWTLD
jgi:hypothetical protein